MDTTDGTVLDREAAADTPAEESPEITALVVRAQAGDAEAFGDLMRMYERRVILLGVQMGLSHDDALDAAQDAFLKVFRYIGRFRSGRSFFKWLYRIAVHAIYDHVRRARTVPVVSFDDPSVPAEVDRISAAGSSPLDTIAARDLARRVVDGLDVLARKERIVFVLRDMQQVATVDVARILGMSQITVRRHCMSARRKLRDRLFPASE